MGRIRDVWRDLRFAENPGMDRLRDGGSFRLALGDGSLRSAGGSSTRPLTRPREERDYRRRDRTFCTHENLTIS